MPAAILIPIIASVASTAGSITYSLISARNQRKKPVDIGKNDDVRVTGSDYGAFIPRVWGIARLSGNIIFSNGVQTYTTTSTSGGSKKQGGGQAEINYIYKTSVGVLVCRGEIGEFKRVWADLNVYYSGSAATSTNYEAEDETLAGGASVSTSGVFSGTGYVTALGNGGTLTFDVSAGTEQTDVPIEPGEPAPFTRLSFYYKCPEARTATVTVNDGTGPVVSTLSFPASTSWTAKTIICEGHLDSVLFENASTDAPDLDKLNVLKYMRAVGGGGGSPAYALTGAVNPAIEYPKDLDDPSEFYNYLPEASAEGITDVNTPIPGEQLRFYTGTADQTQDAALIAWLDTKHGTGQGELYASAHRGLAYMMLQDHTIPNGQLENFVFEIDTYQDDVNDVLTDLFADVNLTVDDYDISATATGYTQLGVLEHSGGSRKQLIEQLGKYHFFRLAEIDGEIKTIPDTYTSSVTVTTNQMRAHQDSEEMPAYDAEVLIKEETLMPREIRVSAMNPDLEFHNESVASTVFADTAATESKEYTFSIVARPSQTRNVAERLLLKEWSEDKTVEFYGMPELAKYTVGECITIPINGANHLCRIEKMTTTLPLGKVKFECVKTGYYYENVVYDDTTTTTQSKQLAQFAKQTFPRNTIVFVIQSEPIRDRDEGRLGVYLAICGRGVGVGDKAALYREMDEDNFVPQAVIENMSPVGLAESALPSHSTTSEDVTNPLTISFFDDVSLETVTADDITRNPLVNLIRVGDEWIQFRTAGPETLDSSSPYRSRWTISNLQRGRFNTATNTHVSGEYCAVVTPSLMFFDLDSFDVGKTVTLKAATAGQDPENAPATVFTFAGNDATGDIEPLFDHFTDASAADGTLYIDQIDAGQLATNGDKITVEYSGILTANANPKNLFLKWGSTTIFDSSTFNESGSHWKLTATLLRVSNTVIRSAVHFETANPFTPVYTEVTGLNLTTTDYDIELYSVTDDPGDLTAKLGYGLFIPAATTNTADVMMFGEALTFGGEAITFTPGAENSITLSTMVSFSNEYVTFLGDTTTFTGA